jgi:hypothetical protein
VRLWERIDRNGVATYAAAALVVGALFPRLAHLARWPTRLRGTRLLIYTGFNTALGFAMRQFVGPRLRATAAKWEGVKRELRDELGREPTSEELAEKLG